MSMKVNNVYDNFILTILLYTYTTMLYTIIQKVIPINKLLGVYIYLLVFYIYIKTLKKRDIAVFLGVFVTTVFSALNSISSNSIEHIQYFVITVLMLNKFTEPIIVENFKKSVKKFNKSFGNTAIVIGILTIITVFLPSCYINNGESIVLKGFCPHSHTFSSCMCLLMTIVFCYLNEKKIKLIHLILFMPFLLGIFKGGARTFLISALLLLVMFYFKKLRDYPLKHLLVFVGSIIIGYFLLNSTIISRFYSTANNKYISDNKLEAVTSGRLIWWQYDLEEYDKYPIIKKIFGGGYDVVFDVNEERYGKRIWAHNDFIQILLSTGIVGIVIYLRQIFNWIKLQKQDGKLLFGIYVMFTAFVNGFYIYQHYVFSSILLILVIKETKNYESNSKSEKKISSIKYIN